MTDDARAVSTVGLIGLGHMGKPMCLNLLKKGFTVYAHKIPAGDREG